MIAQLTGRIDHIGKDWVLLDVAGVGYRVSCSARTLRLLPAVGETGKLLTEMQVREDYLGLIGFADALEQEWYLLLNSVQGVGSRVALAILSVVEPAQLQNTILAQDKAVLTQADGVGPKLASRLMNELKDKVGKLPVSHLPGAENAGTNVEAPTPVAANDDAVAGLLALGYGRLEAYQAVAKAQATAGDNATVEVLIKTALQRLSA